MKTEMLMFYSAIEEHRKYRAFSKLSCDSRHGVCYCIVRRDAEKRRDELLDAIAGAIEASEQTPKDIEETAIVLQSGQADGVATCA